LLKVSLTVRGGGKFCQHFFGIVLLAVEAPIYEILQAIPQWIEQGRDDQGGEDNDRRR